MANAGGTCSKHEHILEALLKEGLIAILADDVKRFESVLKRSKNSSCQRCGLENLLSGRNHTFQPVGKEYNQALLRILRGLLVDQPQLLSDRDYWADLDKRSPDFSALLNRHLFCYKGKLSHVAAFLGRTQIVKVMANSVIFREDQELALFDRSDCFGKTALMLAVQGHHRQTMKEIIERLKDIKYRGYFSKEIAAIVAKAVYRYTNDICYDPDLQPALEMLLSEGKPLADVSDTISLMWHIFCKNLEGVARKLDWDCVSCKGGVGVKLHPLHYAVRLYSSYSLTAKETDILEFLLNRCPDCKSLNYVNRWRLHRGRGNEVLDGTVVHFALSTYQPRKLCCIHPGYDEGGHLRVISDTLPGSREGPDSPHVQMLKFLSSRGADLWKPNHYNKTPMDCLPCDADPYLINLLIGEKGKNKDDEERENEDEKNNNKEKENENDGEDVEV